MQNDLDLAERAMTDIEESLKFSQQALVDMLSADSVSLEDLNLKEQHLDLISRLIIRARQRRIGLGDAEVGQIRGIAQGQIRDRWCRRRVAGIAAGGAIGNELSHCT